MQDEVRSTDTDFAHWQELNEAYANGIEALRRHEPGALEVLRRIASEMRSHRVAIAQAGDAGAS